MSNGHLSKQHLSWRHLSISTISQLLLVRFWPNFKGRFLGPIWTYSNFQNDICSGNICPCDIYPYQEYLSCHKPDFDQTLKVGSWDHLEHIPTVTKIPQQKFCQQKSSTRKKLQQQKNSGQKKFAKKKILKNKFCQTKFLPTKHFLAKNICKKNFTEIEIVKKKICQKDLLQENVFNLKKNSTKRISPRIFFWQKWIFCKNEIFFKKIAKKIFCQKKISLKIRLLKKNLPKKIIQKIYCQKKFSRKFFNGINFCHKKICKKRFSL